MASVRLGPDGEVEVLVPPTPEEVAEAEEALHRVIEALARLAAKQDWAATTEGSEPEGERSKRSTRPRGQ